MKKYIVALIPFIVCSILSLSYKNIEPKDFPDPTFPYHTQGVLYYLSTRWFMIGIVLSIIFFIFIFMDDISNFIEKKIWERRIIKHNKSVQ